MSVNGKKFFFGIACVIGISSVAFGQTFPQRLDGATSAQAPFSSTGLIDTQVGSAFYRGSGAVARDSRLVFTCAHTAFDRGVWANSIRIAVGWNARFDATNYAELRGWRYFASYASSALENQDSPETFGLDFLVGFSTTPLGPVVRVRENGATVLMDASVHKMIVGYPAVIDFNDQPGLFFMHRTGPFAGSFTQESGSYYGISRVSTGSGNSGGPLFESSTGVWTLSAILVSGSKNSLGVFAIDPAAIQLSDRALEALGSAPPSPTPTPASNWSGGSSSPAYTVDGLLALQASLVTRIDQARRIKDPKARAIQSRRLRFLLLEVYEQISAQS